MTTILETAKANYLKAPKSLPFALSDVWRKHQQTMAGLIPNFLTCEEAILRAQASGHTEAPEGVGFDHRIAFNPVLIQAKVDALKTRFPGCSIPSESPLSHHDSLGPLDGVIVSNAFLWHLEAYLACICFIPRPRSVLEIGGGYGGLARIFALSGIEYAITDIPESLFFAEVFLKTNGVNNVRFIPAGQPLGNYDLAINQGGFGEMPQETVDYWAEALKGKVQYVYSLNYHGDGPNFTGAVFRGWKAIREEMNPLPIMGDVRGNWLEAIYAPQ